MGKQGCCLASLFHICNRCVPSAMEETTVKEKQSEAHQVPLWKAALFADIPVNAPKQSHPSLLTGRGSLLAAQRQLSTKELPAPETTCSSPFGIPETSALAQTSLPQQTMKPRLCPKPPTGRVLLSLARRRACSEGRGCVRVSGQSQFLSCLKIGSFINWLEPGVKNL